MVRNVGMKEKDDIQALRERLMTHLYLVSLHLTFFKIQPREILNLA